MNTKFKIDGCYELEIRSDGTIGSYGNVQSFSRGNIGISLHCTGLPNLDEVATPETVAGLYLKRSQARAIASALLSAVSEAQ